VVYTQQSFPTCVAAADLLTPLPRRWRQGRCKTAGTWRTCPLRVQHKIYGSFGKQLFETAKVFPVEYIR